MRVQPGFRTAVVVGAVLAALSLSVTGEAGPKAQPGSWPLRAAAGVTSADVRVDAALLTPGRQTQPGAWSERRLPTHFVGVVGLLSLAAAVFSLSRTGTTRFCPLLRTLSLAGGTGGPRGPPLLQLT